MYIKFHFAERLSLFYKLAPENTNSTRLKKSIFGCSSQVYLSSILIGIFIIVRELTAGRDSDAVFDSTFPNTSLLVWTFVNLFSLFNCTTIRRLKNWLISWTNTTGLFSHLCPLIEILLSWSVFFVFLFKIASQRHWCFLTILSNSCTYCRLLLWDLRWLIQLPLLYAGVFSHFGPAHSGVTGTWKRIC